MVVVNLLTSAGYRATHHHIKTGDVDIYRIDYPRNLPEEAKEVLLDSLMPVAASAFRQQETDLFRKDVQEHIFGFSGLFVVVNEEGVPVAFRVWEFIELNFVAGTDILYLAGMCVHEAWQRQGIGTLLLQCILREDHRRSLPDAHSFGPLPLAPYVAMRTQSPLVKWNFDQSIKRESYPLIEEEGIPVDIARVGQIVTRHLGDTSFETQTMISRECYGRCLYGVAPTSPDEGYNKAFNKLNVDDGDTMICVWRRPEH